MNMPTHVVLPFKQQAWLRTLSYKGATPCDLWCYFMRKAMVEHGSAYIIEMLDMRAWEHKGEDFDVNLRRLWYSGRFFRPVFSSRRRKR